MEYKGLNVDDMRTLRDFVLQHRLAALDFAWFHPTAVEVATYVPYPSVSQLVYIHGLFSGMWVGVSNSPNTSLNGGVFPVLRQQENAITLMVPGTGVAGNAYVITYVPHARIVAEQDTFAAPTTLIGPEVAPRFGIYGGRYSYSVTIEELF